MRYALEMKKILDIANDESTPIDVRVELSDALVGIHKYNLRLFEEYMLIRKRLSLYEY